jgi:hypothetical protein
MNRRQGGIRAELYRYVQKCRALCPVHLFAFPLDDDDAEVTALKLADLEKIAVTPEPRVKTAQDSAERIDERHSVSLARLQVIVGHELTPQCLIALKDFWCTHTRKSPHNLLKDVTIDC